MCGNEDAREHKKSRKVRSEVISESRQSGGINHREGDGPSFVNELPLTTLVVAVLGGW